MAAKDWASVAAGLALAGFGLGAFVASGGAAATTAPPPATTAVVETVPAVGTVTVSATMPAPAADIPGLSDTAARVLSANGYAGVAQGADVGLPPAVVRVLEGRNTVLLVADGGGS